MEGEITSPCTSSRRSASVTPQSCCSNESDLAGDFTPRSSPSSTSSGDRTTSWFEIKKHESLCELQQMLNHYNDCFRLLKHTLTAIDLLREENLNLTSENLELQCLVEERERAASVEAVAGLTPVKLEKMIGLGGGRSDSDLDSSGGDGFGSGSGSGSSGSGSVLTSESGSGSGSDGSLSGRLPKSISIRSRGFLAVNQIPVGGAHRLRLPVSRHVVIFFSFRISAKSCPFSKFKSKLISTQRSETYIR